MVHRENPDVLIWVENSLKIITTILKLKMVSFRSNQLELAVFTLHNSTNKLLGQSVVNIAIFLLR